MTRGVPPGKARSRARAHACTPDPDVPGYNTCGLPADHVSHDLPPVSAEQRAAEQRRVGERGS